RLQRGRSTLIVQGNVDLRACRIVILNDCPKPIDELVELIAARRIPQLALEYFFERRRWLSKQLVNARPVRAPRRDDRIDFLEIDERKRYFLRSRPPYLLIP